MDFYNKSLYPGRLPEPVSLLVWCYPWLYDDDPNGVVLTCSESENAVGYQLLSGSDPYNVAGYNIVSDSNSRPAITAAMLPSSDTWWTVRVRDAHGSTIYADPIRVDSLSALGAIPTELVDFNRDFKVDMQDFSELARHWRQYDPSVDIIPAPNGDGVVDVKDLAILLECWLKEVLPVDLIAHWKLDETEGTIAHDSISNKNGNLNGNPIWQPAGGAVLGALQLDGTDDYVSTPFVLNPADGAFSVYAWVKQGAPGQSIISQTGTLGASWLLADSAGCLMTYLRSPRRGAQPLVSEFVITDGDWHHIYLVWDGAYRSLYADGVKVKKDLTDQGGLTGADGGLHFGTGSSLAVGSFWTGLIDEIKIYEQAVAP